MFFARHAWRNCNFSESPLLSEFDLYFDWGTGTQVAKIDFLSEPGVVSSSQGQVSKESLPIKRGGDDGVQLPRLYSLFFSMFIGVVFGGYFFFS